ncbi:MAG TPA: amidohydrolase family protein [Terriglobales bacterium]|nr:amidohydrolase family protein [Terriglobales bacterium]
MASERLCISADSHVVEPAEFFEPLAAIFGDEAPRVVTPDPALGPKLDLGNGKLGISISGLLQQNVDFTSPEARESLRLGYDLARPGCYDTTARLSDQDMDGIDAEVLYPSVLFNVYQIENLDIVKATFRLYNDWVADYCSQQPKRLFPLGSVQLYDLDEAISEMERAKQMGHVGICIAATAPPDRLYSDPWYDRFWAAAQDMRLPLNMHIFTGATDNHGLAPRQASSRANGPMGFAGAGMTICDLIQSGVCERFPDLKFVLTEFETGWIAHVLRRLDWAFVRGGGERATGLKMLPSQYWRRNFYCTFEDDPLGIMTRDFIGTETMMWGNDYPHGDSVFPHSRQVLSEILSDCTDEERWQLTVKNVVDLYDLPFELEGPNQASINAIPTPEVKTWRNAMPLTDVTMSTPLR